jgi:thioredoxin reductase (NADPH)
VKIGDEWHETKTLIIAAGSKPRTLKLPREKEFIGRGLSVCATCDGAFFKGKDVAVIGGGDSAMEEADFLTKFVNHVTVLVRGDSLRASEIMAERAKENPKITIKYNEEVKEYIGDQFISGAKIFNNKTNEEYELPVSGLFFAIGQQPETGIFADKLPVDSEGYLSKGCNNTMTNVEGIFIAGDISDKIYRQAIVAAGEGAKAAIDVARYMHEKKM